jgi:hypothetical protein
MDLRDFFESSDKLTPASLDGIFFDPWLPREIADDECLWAEVMPRLVRALRPGGVLIPFFFSTQPVLKWPFRDYFSKVIVERRCFQAYPATEYTHGTAGQAYIQCFLK